MSHYNNLGFISKVNNEKILVIRLGNEDDGVKWHGKIVLKGKWGVRIGVLVVGLNMWLNRGLCSVWISFWVGKVWVLVSFGFTYAYRESLVRE